MQQRKIRFRFWDGTSGNMCMAYTAADGYITYSSGFKIPMTQAIAENNATEGYDKPKALMQYTGLKDKNGVEIYEGDILQYVVPEEHDDGSACDERYEVTWLSYGFGARWINPPNGSRSSSDPSLSLAGSDADLAVIGNIYENRDLLESKS